MSDLQNLWIRYVEAEPLAAAESKALAAAIAGDAGFRAACLADQAIRGLLAEALIARKAGDGFAERVLERVRAEDSAASFVAAVTAHLPGDGHSQRLPRLPGQVGPWRRMCSGAGRGLGRSTFTRPVALAIVVLVAVAALLFPRSDRLQGPVEILQVAKQVVIGAGDQASLHGVEAVGELSDADSIAAAGGPVTVSYHGSLISLAAGSRIDFAHDAKTGSTIRLRSGNITCTVAEQIGHRRFRVATPHAIAEVVGTVFTVRRDSQEDSTVLWVSRGQVDFIDAVRGKRFAVGPGQTAVANLQGLRWEAASEDEAMAPFIEWRFDQSPADGVIRARGPTGLDLHIAHPERVRWSASGLEIEAETMLATARPPTELLEAIRRSRGLTIDLTITPASNRTSFDAARIGMSRIITWSRDATERNVSIGQGDLHGDDQHYAVRVRGGQEGIHANGLPPITATGPVRVQPTRLILTLEADRTRFYRDGKLVATEQRRIDFERWDEGMRLGLAGEFGEDPEHGQRPWFGTYHALRIYTRALSEVEAARLRP